MPGIERTHFKESCMSKHLPHNHTHTHKTLKCQMDNQSLFLFVCWNSVHYNFINDYLKNFFITINKNVRKRNNSTSKRGKSSMSNLQKSMMRSHLPPCVPSAARYVSNNCTSFDLQVFFAHYNPTCFAIIFSGNRRGRLKDYVPTMWNEHFTEKEDVMINENQFRVYFTNRDKENKKPLLVLLHGGGYSALTWAHFTVNKLVITVLRYFFWLKHPSKWWIFVFHLIDWNYGDTRLSMFGHRLKRSWWLVRHKWIGSISKRSCQVIRIIIECFRAECALIWFY